MAKEFAKFFYKSTAWKKTRSAYGQRVGWLCEECLAAGIIKPGKIVHHKIELTPNNINNFEISLGFDNLKLVCMDCHAKEHSCKKNRRYLVGVNGEIIIR